MPFRIVPATLRLILDRGRLALRLLRDPAVPVTTKAITLLPAAYVVLPLDLMPDLLPLLGQLDDLGAVALALELFIALCPPEAVAHHHAAIARGVPYTPLRPPRPDAGPEVIIDAEWRRED